MEGGNACKLCFEIFKENLRPRMLPCGHSYCTSCLVHLFRNRTLTCPTCKKIHLAGNVEEFPINYDLEELISNSKKTEVSVAPKLQKRPISKGLQRLIDNQRITFENLILVSEKLKSQMNEYIGFLSDKKTKHEEIFQKFLKLVKQNEEIIKLISNEKQKVIERQKAVVGIIEEMKEKLQNLDDATDTKTAVAAVDELDQRSAALEDWNEIFEQFPNADILIFSNKVLIKSTAALSMVDSESDEIVTEIPDFSKTNFSILEKASKICGKCTLSVETFQFMSQEMKNLVEKGWVYAIQDKEGVIRSARISLTNNKLYLHCLQDKQPPAHVHTIKHDEVIDVVNTNESNEVFLDLTWEGSFKGRVSISLFGDTPLSFQFRMLCTGDVGPSYAQSNFFHVYEKGRTTEYVEAGDYEYNDGKGGASIVEGTDMFEPIYRHPYVEGRVGTYILEWDKSHGAQFYIATGEDDPTRIYEGVFGQVLDGLSVVRSAAKLENIKQVEINDCGVVIPL